MEFPRHRKKNGFTLIEIIVVIAIGMVLTTGVSYGTLYSVSGLDLNSAVYDVSTALETARDYTLDHYNTYSYYGVTFATSSVTLFGYVPATSTKTTIQTTTLPADVKLTYSGFSSGNSVYFNSVTGLASTTGTITLKAIIGSQTLTVSSQGIINVQ